MSWLLVVPLALAAFALAAFAFRLDRAVWTSLLTALVLGLAGYALQARPELAGAPRAASEPQAQEQWGSVEARQEMIAPRYRSGSDRLLIADALARRGHFADASVMLRGAVDQNPRDGEAWLALGNVLVEHAEGILTPAALHAFGRAAEAAPGSAAPGYFLGLALIREGRIGEARQVWAAALETAGDGEPAALLAQRAARLDALLTPPGAPTGPADPGPPPAP